MNSVEPQISCRRCGVCCAKGGPALHLEDLPLLREGRIGLECLITLRRGELAWDQPAQELRPLDEELVKLRGVSANDWRCVFHEQRGCGIYESRPAECRALACWDTSALEAMYARDRARRIDILTARSGLWPLIEEHERRCSLPELGELAALVLEDEEGSSAEKELLELVAYDAALREAFSARALAADSGLEQALEFFFGRSLASALALYGLSVRKEKSAFRMSRVKTPHTTWGGRRSACI